MAPRHRLLRAVRRRARPAGSLAVSDRLAFGLIAWGLTLRTSGLEAAFALHAVNNFVVLIAAAATDEIESSRTASDIAASMALFDIAVLAVSGYLLDRNVRRLGVATRTAGSAT